MKKYNILDFIREHHMDIWEEFARYKRKDTLPAIGTKVITLVNGYSGRAGVTRYVVAHEGRYVVLAKTSDGSVRSLCEVSKWWKHLRIVDEPKEGEMNA